MNTGNARVDSLVENVLGIQLEDYIGHGRYGSVYRGLSNGRQYAVKIISLPTEEQLEQLRDIYGDDDERIEAIVRDLAGKFNKEIESMEALMRERSEEQTKNIVRIKKHILNQDGIYFDIIIVMELLYPLKKFLQKEEFTVEDVIDIGLETAQGLIVCHRNGIIHRDIKEDNLFLDRHNNVKIGDFGVANIKQNENDGRKTGGVGTPHYMAPEMRGGEGAYDITVDIYSLGMVMYMLCNNNLPPFCDSDVDSRAAYEMRMQGRPLTPPAHGCVQLSEVILKCTAYDPAQRYRDATALANALGALKQTLSEDVLGIALPYPKRHIVDEDWWKNMDLEQTEDVNTARMRDDILSKTIDIFNNIIGRFGQKDNASKFIRSTHAQVGVAEKAMNEAERKLRGVKKLLVGTLCVLVVLGVTLVMLYPKTATFFSNTSDGGKIYVRYLFLSERKLSDRSAAYLSSDGKYLYFSDNNEEHSLYRANIWNGKAELLDSGSCEYDIVIGDYIYFTDRMDNENLYRIKKDGTGKEIAAPGIMCRGLQNNNGVLSVEVVQTGKRTDISEDDEAFTAVDK